MGRPPELGHLPGDKSHTGSCDRILRGRRGGSKPSPGRVWAGICRKELDQLSQIPLYIAFSSRMWILLHRGETTDPSGGNIPVELGREMCPNPQPWHPCPDPN